MENEATANHSPDVLEHVHAPLDMPDEQAVDAAEADRSTVAAFRAIVSELPRGDMRGDMRGAGDRFSPDGNGTELRNAELRGSEIRSVSAAQFVRQFAECRSLAQDEPVFISNYGRTTHALVGINQFDAMAVQAENGGKELTARELLQDFGQWHDSALLVCNAALDVQYINPIGAMLCGTDSASAKGFPLERVLQGRVSGRGARLGEDRALSRSTSSHAMKGRGQEALIINLAQRCLQGREPVSAEVPSPFAKDRWLKILCIVWQEHLVITLKDITHEVRSERLADKQNSLLEAMALHDTVIPLRLSMRAVVEEAGRGLTLLTGLAMERMIGISFLDMVDISSRPALREAIEAVVQQAERKKITIRMLTNAGTLREVNASMVQLRGSYGLEGITMVLSLIK